METKDYLTNYYERCDENGRLVSKHDMVEYLTTMKYVEKYLKPNMRVSEIGAATGRYSHALAQKGYRVDASVLTYGFIRGEIYSIIEKSMLNTETFDTFSNPWDVFELYRKEDIDNLRNEFNVTQLHFVASDGYTNYMRETVDQMDDRMYDLYLKYHFAVC